MKRHGVTASPETKQWSIMLLRTSALILALFAIAIGHVQQVQAKEQLVIGMTQFPSTLHPNIDSMAAKSYVLGMTHRPFTQYNADWELVCYLCVKLPLIEDGDAVIEPQPDGSDGIALTYQIDPDAVWGDGVSVTTEDVIFTWEVGRHPKSGVGNAELYRRMLSIDVIDEKTFTIHDEKLGFDYNSIGDFRLLPAHLERPVFESDPQTYRNRTLFDTDPSNPGLWMGPYRVAEVSTGSHIVVERNPLWWKDSPVFDKIVVKAIENSAALEANLLSGDVEMIEGSIGLSLDQALAFDARHGDDYQVFYKPGLIYEHIDLNLENPILSDQRVRRALIMSIDREALSQQLFDGRQPVAATSVSPLDWIYDPNVPTYVEDLDEANRLLDEAGWSSMKAGIRHHANGEPLRLVLMTTAGNRTRELVQQVLQGMWRRVGIDIQIKNEPARVLFGETITHRRFDHMAMFAWISSPENVPRTTLHSDAIPAEENGWTGQNYTGFRSDDVDELLDAIEIELDRESRRGLWSQLQTIYAGELPALPLYFRSHAHIWPSWLTGVVPTGHLAPTTLGVEHWQVSQ